MIPYSKIKILFGPIYCKIISFDALNEETVMEKKGVKTWTTGTIFNSLYNLLSLVVFTCNQNFSIKKFCIMSTLWMFVFYVDLRTNSGYFPHTALNDWFV